MLQSTKSISNEPGYESLPRRIFLDTNILQYLQDFGEFIFDHYQEDERYLISPRGKKILTGSALYNEIEALRFLFLGIDRANIEFVVSKNTFEEVKKKQDARYKQWFFEIWDYWQNILREHEGRVPFKLAGSQLDKFDQDQSILGRLSKSDSRIIRDAIFFDCHAVLTTDKFLDLYKEIEVKYKLMILCPTGFLKLIEPSQALWY